MFSIMWFHVSSRHRLDSHTNNVLYYCHCTFLVTDNCRENRRTFKYNKKIQKHWRENLSYAVVLLCKETGKFCLCVLKDGLRDEHEEEEESKKK